MKMRHLKVCLVASALALAAAPTVSLAQAAAPKTAYKAPRTLGNIPDLQGTWTNASLTPLERQAAYGNRLALTPEEAAKLEGAQAESFAARNQPTKPDTKIEDLPCSPGFTGTNCGYNAGWTDPGETVMRVNGQPRTSFITSTPDGRVPPSKVAAAGRPAAAARPAAAPAAGGAPRQDDNPETRSLGERCLMSFGQSTGPIMLPQLYNNNYRIVQSKDAVAILVEMVHDTRIVRLNSKHRTDGVRPWMGDSIGWYAGDTLVVETTNYHPSQRLRGGGPSDNLKVTEKFTRVGPQRLLYQFTVEDPTAWDQPWGGEYEFGEAKGDVYEYACHEGNYALEGILAGARNDEAIAAGKATLTPPPAGINPEYSRGAAAAQPVPRGE